MERPQTKESPLSHIIEIGDNDLPKSVVEILSAVLPEKYIPKECRMDAEPEKEKELLRLPDELREKWENRNVIDIREAIARREKILGIKKIYGYHFTNQNVHAGQTLDPSRSQSSREKSRLCFIQKIYIQCHRGIIPICLSSREPVPTLRLIQIWDGGAPENHSK